MSNRVARDGHVFVCCACGKRSNDVYGEEQINHGWDASCVINCKEFPVAWLTVDPESNRVTKITEPDGNIDK